MIEALLYLISLIVVAAILQTENIGVNNWKYWVVLIMLMICKWI